MYYSYSCFYLLTFISFNFWWWIFCIAIFSTIFSIFFIDFGTIFIILLKKLIDFLCFIYHVIITILPFSLYIVFDKKTQFFPKPYWFDNFYTCPHFCFFVVGSMCIPSDHIRPLRYIQSFHMVHKIINISIYHAIYILLSTSTTHIIYIPYCQSMITTNNSIHESKLLFKLMHFVKIWKHNVCTWSNCNMVCMYIHLMCDLLPINKCSWKTAFENIRIMDFHHAWLVMFCVMPSLMYTGDYYI